MITNWIAASFIHQGLLGGWVMVDEEGFHYKTGKLTIEDRFRHLVLNDVSQLSFNGLYLKVVFEESYSFLVFGKRKLLSQIKQYHPDWIQEA